MWPPKTDTIRNIDKSFLDEKNTEFAEFRKVVNVSLIKDLAVT